MSVSRSSMGGIVTALRRSEKDVTNSVPDRFVSAACGARRAHSNAEDGVAFGRMPTERGGCAEESAERCRQCPRIDEKTGRRRCFLRSRWFRGVSSEQEGMRVRTPRCTSNRKAPEALPMIRGSVPRRSRNTRSSLGPGQKGSEYGRKNAGDRARRACTQRIGW